MVHLTHQRLYMTTAMAVVGGRVDRSRSTCFTPGGTLLTHRSSFSNIFNTGMVKLAWKKDKSLRDAINRMISQNARQLETDMILTFFNFAEMGTNTSNTSYKVYEQKYKILVKKMYSITIQKTLTSSTLLWVSYPFSRTSRSHFRCAATFSASSFRVRFLRLSAGGWTWFCSFTEGLDACSRNWMISCTPVGSVGNIHRDTLINTVQQSTVISISKYQHEL